MYPPKVLYVNIYSYFVEIVTDYFLGLQNHCSLLLGRKALTNLDSILKSRDITLPKKVHLVEAMFFPVVKYGCENRTIKKAECRRIDALNCDVGEDS